MARLILHAVSQESGSVDLVYQLRLFISVSRAEDGSPVTGLTLENFRVCSRLGASYRFELKDGKETNWEGADRNLSGCYSLGIVRVAQPEDGSLLEWTPGEYYSFGLGVVSSRGASGESDFGQTVIRIESLGR